MAIRGLWLCRESGNVNGHNNRYWLDRAIKSKFVSADDPWVAAALGCVNDADIPDVALEFFLADVKAGYYDLHAPDPIASP